MLARGDRSTVGMWERRRETIHQPNGVKLAMTRLATGPRLHYAEQGNPIVASRD